MYPNPAQPVHAVFVHRRVSHAAKLSDMRVLAPIPWFPFERLVAKYRHRRQIPKTATIGELDVHYPRFLSIPAVCKPLDGLFLFLTIWWQARKLRRGGFDFDLIDAHLAFPDGYAGRLLGRLLGRPLTVTLRGHDVNDLPRFPIRRRQVLTALKGARRVMAVADALRRAAVDLGCPEDNTETIPNGVETSIFYPSSRDEARERLGLPRRRRIVVSVGHLVERKGYHVVLDAMARLRERGIDDVHYCIVGGPGEEGNALPLIEERIREHGLEDYVTMPGATLNEDLRAWYAAADVSCLASSKEGWANVLLESLACGKPVVATRVWGTPEVISSDDLGILVDRTPESIAEGLERAFLRRWDSEAIAEYARGFTWQQVGERVVDNYLAALERRPAPAPSTA